MYAFHLLGYKRGTFLLQMSKRLLMNLLMLIIFPLRENCEWNSSYCFWSWMHWRFKKIKWKFSLSHQDGGTKKICVLDSSRFLTMCNIFMLVTLCSTTFDCICCLYLQESCQVVWNSVASQEVACCFWFLVVMHLSCVGIVSWFAKASDIHNCSSWILQVCTLVTYFTSYIPNN
jgi:hypothetical protein